jgi:hypothetical protein
MLLEKSKIRGFRGLREGLRIGDLKGDHAPLHRYRQTRRPLFGFWKTAACWSRDRRDGSLRLLRNVLAARDLD